MGTPIRVITLDGVQVVLNLNHIDHFTSFELGIRVYMKSGMVFELEHRWTPILTKEMMSNEMNKE